MQILGTPDMPGRWADIDSKLTRGSWVMIVFLLGWMSSTGYYGVTKLWADAHKAETVQKVVVPHLLKENWRLQHTVKDQAPDVGTEPKKCDPQG